MCTISLAFLQIANRTLTNISAVSNHRINIFLYADDDEIQQSDGGGSSAMQNLLEFIQQLGEGLGDVVGASGVIVGQVIGGLPLPDHVLSAGVVEISVVVEDSAFNQQVSKADSSAKATEILHSHIVSVEEVEKLGRLDVLDVEDFLAEDSGVVGAVGDGSGVEDAIKSAGSHRYVIRVYKIYLRKLQQQLDSLKWKQKGTFFRMSVVGLMGPWGEMESVGVWFCWRVDVILSFLSGFQLSLNSMYGSFLQQNSIKNQAFLLRKWCFQTKCIKNYRMESGLSEIIGSNPPCFFENY